MRRVSPQAGGNKNGNVQPSKEDLRALLVDVHEPAGHGRDLDLVDRDSPDVVRAPPELVVAVISDAQARAHEVAGELNAIVDLTVDIGARAGTAATGG